MSSNNNFVSVIMSTYNSINTLDTAIESIMNQTYQNLELLIMDDCSEDGSYEKINYCASCCKLNYIRIIRPPQISLQNDIFYRVILYVILLHSFF